MAQATLRTARLVLVPLTDEHLELEVELDADPEVMRHLAAGPSTREVTEDAHRRRLELARQAPGMGLWVGLADGRPVGWWLLRPRPDAPVPGEAELGYRLVRRYWRRGLAREGARELVRHGFSDLGLWRVFGETMVVNTASRATMLAVGMREAGRFSLEGRAPRPGLELGGVEYATTRDEWLRGSPVD